MHVADSGEARQKPGVAPARQSCRSDLAPLSPAGVNDSPVSFSRRETGNVFAV